MAVCGNARKHIETICRKQPEAGSSLPPAAGEVGVYLKSFTKQTLDGIAQQSQTLERIV